MGDEIIEREWREVERISKQCLSVAEEIKHKLDVRLAFLNGRYYELVHDKNK